MVEPLIGCADELRDKGCDAFFGQDICKINHSTEARRVFGIPRIRQDDNDDRRKPNTSANAVLFKPKVAAMVSSISHAVRFCSEVIRYTTMVRDPIMLPSRAFMPWSKYPRKLRAYGTMNSRPTKGTTGRRQPTN